MTDAIDWISRSGAKPKGRRPDFLGNTNEERMLSMLMALVAEVSVVRERLDTVERLLEAKGTISRADIEGYAPDLETGKERNRIIREYLARIMRPLQHELEATANPEPTIDEVVDELTH
ncbi:hypothetical protein [Novosphingobium sp.]|uniref:hypothetical protein n=1 Tax=Novosphingobium sp. TaxID=1874826 RepID=UPI001ED1EC7F|nr:hypothetical protein [Novosphingobium sp.]MBK9009322.1 hypothetical protein [Novosphingobium sp.]